MGEPATLAAARAATEALPGLKEAELVKLGPCAACGKPLLDQDKGGLTFYRVEISRAAFSPAAVQRRVGASMMMGSDALAALMGPNEDLAKVFDGPRAVAVHEGCAMVGHLLDLLSSEGGDHV